MESTNTMANAGEMLGIRGRSHAWTYDSVITLIVTLAIMLDWAPSYYLGTSPALFSFTKFLVTPIILFDILAKFSSYLRSKAMVYGLIYLTLFMVGVGGGYLYGTISWHRFFELLPTVPILFFYLKRRTRAEVEVVIRYAFYASLLVPVSLVLAKLGILAPSLIGQFDPAQVAQFDLHAGDLRRIYAGTSSSETGLFLVFPAVMIGGIAIRKKLGGLSWVGDAIVGLIILAGLVGALVTAQRAAIFIYILCLVLSLVMNFKSGKGKRIGHIVVVLIMLALAMGLFATQIKKASETAMFRLRTTTEEHAGSGLSGRTAFYDTLYTDLTTRPHLTAPGSEELFRKFGVGPHLILGEAYYDGGLVLMVVLLWGIVLGGVRALREWRTDRRHGGIPIGGILFLLWLGFFVYLSADPGLHSRLVYMILGLCIGRQREKAASLAATTPTREA